MTADLTPETLQSMAHDPATFQAAVVIPSAHGPRRFGDVMADFQRERFAAINPALSAVANGETPHPGRYWWEATKGASKDSDLAVCLLWLLAFSRRSLTCQIGAGDADQAAELRKAAGAIVRLNPWLTELVDVQTWAIVNRHTDSRADIIAADVLGSHGSRPDVLIVNELSHVGRQEFAETLLDNASKMPAGLVVIATNAGWLDTWQSRWRESFAASGRWSFHVQSEPAPWLDSAEIAEARQRNSASRYSRLWAGVWAPEGQGDALDEADIRACQSQAGPIPAGMLDFAPYHAGIDLGVRRDASGLVIVGTDFRAGVIRVARIEKWLPADYGGDLPLALVKAAILQAHEDYHLHSIIGDPWESRYLCQELARELPEVYVATPAVNPAWQNRQATCLMTTLRQRTLAYPADARLIRDLRKLSVVEKPEGFRLASVRDAEGHADVAAALATVLPHAIDVANAIIGEQESFASPQRVCA